jgi:HEPN domain-containing protein
MKKATREWVEKAEGDFLTARKLLRGRPLLNDSIGYHCQQAIEKYLKALRQELGLAVPRIHDVGVLLDLLIPFDRTLRSLKRGSKTLTAFAVEYRYPGRKATPRQARWAVQKAEIFRIEIRRRLGLRTRRSK